jgi:hypothetical protein
MNKSAKIGRPIYGRFLSDLRIGNADFLAQIGVADSCQKISRKKPQIGQK